MTKETSEIIEKIFNSYCNEIENRCYYGNSIYVEEVEEIFKDALNELAKILESDK